MSALPPRTDRLETLERAVVALDARVDQLDKLADNGRITDDRLLEEVARISERQTQIRREMDQMKAPSDGVVGSLKSLLETLLKARNTGRLIAAVLGLALLWWVVVQDGCNTLIDRLAPAQTEAVR